MTHCCACRGRNLRLFSEWFPTIGSVKTIKCCPLKIKIKHLSPGHTGSVRMEFRTSLLFGVQKPSLGQNNSPSHQKESGNLEIDKYHISF